MALKKTGTVFLKVDHVLGPKAKLQTYKELKEFVCSLHHSTNKVAVGTKRNYTSRNHTNIWWLNNTRPSIEWDPEEIREGKFKVLRIMRK